VAANFELIRDGAQRLTHRAHGVAESGPQRQFVVPGVLEDGVACRRCPCGIVGYMQQCGCRSFLVPEGGAGHAGVLSDAAGDRPRPLEERVIADLDTDSAEQLDVVAVTQSHAPCHRREVRDGPGWHDAEPTAAAYL